MSDFIEEYEIQHSKYVSLMNQTVPILDKLLDEVNISIFNIEGRVKTISSLKEKLERKTYSNSFKDIEDLCGLRIICYYESDLDLIEEIIRREFLVTSGSDKQKEIDVDRFGYSSRHFICQFKDEWLGAPLYRDLGGLKMEIQVRTMLMHTWAAISHKLLYKREDDAPREIMRSLSKLSALIELADEKFDEIKGKKIAYNDKVENIPKNEPLNSDNLIALVNKYSPGRKYSETGIPRVLDEIKNYDNTVQEFERRIIKCLPLINNMETEEADFNNHSSLPMWSVDGFCRTVLDLTCDDYYNLRWGDGIPGGHEITMHYRGLLNAG